jgi:hypothetical protein
VQDRSHMQDGSHNAASLCSFRVRQALVKRLPRSSAGRAAVWVLFGPRALGVYTEGRRRASEVRRTHLKEGVEPGMPVCPRMDGGLYAVGAAAVTALGAPPGPCARPGVCGRSSYAPSTAGCHSAS